MHARMALRLSVLEAQAGTGALEQGLGDEDAEPKPAGSFRLATTARREIGLAQARQQVCGKSRAIVADRHLDPRLVPPGFDRDCGPRKMGCIFDEIAEAIEQADAPPNHRLLALRTPGNADALARRR